MSEISIDDLDSKSREIMNKLIKFEKNSNKNIDFMIVQALSTFEKYEKIVKQYEIEANMNNDYETQSKVKLFLKMLKENKEILKKIDEDANNKFELTTTENLDGNNSEIGFDMQNSKLNKGLHKILEIEKNGHNVMVKLSEQTSQMTKVNENLEDMNSQLSNSNSLIGKMLRRENKNRLIIAISIFVFFIIFLVILSENFVGESDKSNSMVNSK